MDSYHGKHSLSMIRYFFMSFWKITRRTSQESGNHVPASIFYILDTDVFCVNKSLVQFLRADCRHEYFVYFMPKTSLFSPLRGLVYLLSAKLRWRRTSRAPLPQLITSQRKEYSTVLYVINYTQNFVNLTGFFMKLR